MLVRLDKAWVWACGAVAVAADLALRRPPWNNIATSALVVGVALGLLATGRIRTTGSRFALGGAVVFGLLLSIRTDPRLIFFNLTAAVLLLLAATAPGIRFFDLRPLHVLRHAGEAFLQPFLLLAEAGPQVKVRLDQRESNPRTARAAGIFRGMLVAAPLLLLLGLLLASADAVFASFFSVPGLDVEAGIGHAVLLATGAAGMAVLIRLSFIDSRPQATAIGPQFGRTETLTVLAGLDLLFGLFAAAQVVARTRGAVVIEASDLSYKAYARQGFFQLLWVAAITLIVLLTIRASTTAWSGRHRLMLILSGTAVLLTLVIVAVAFSRLQLYIADNGLTPLRFYSSVFSIWIGLAFVLVFLRMAGWRAEQAWLFTGIAVSGLVTLFALNLANPEAIIANNNLDRGEQPILWHMEKLTGDGNAVLAEGVDRLPAELQDEVVDRLCSTHDRNGRESGNRDGVLDWNLGQSNGQQALNRLCS